MYHGKLLSFYTLLLQDANTYSTAELYYIHARNQLTSTKSIYEQTLQLTLTLLPSWYKGILVRHHLTVPIV